MIKRLRRAAWHEAQIGIALYGLALPVILLVNEHTSLTAFAENFIFWIVWGSIGLVVVALFSRWRWLLIAAQVPTVAIFLWLYGIMYLPSGVSASGEGPEITAATYNMLGSMSEPDEVLRVIKELNADVIGFQEAGNEQARLAQQDLIADYPYQIWYPSSSVMGVGLISRYPILEHEPFNVPYTPMWQLRAVIDVYGTPVTVYVGHPEPPVSMPPQRYNSDERDQQLEILMDQVESEENPVLFLCDCNMTDRNDIYRHVDARLDDSYREAGWGMGFSFSTFVVSRPRMVRLDYIWHSDDFVARSARVHNNSGTSDHYPVIARLALK
jgi:endonuclease/exonuclease/phosphatase (EEP) superfamily protein YafD